MRTQVGRIFSVILCAVIVFNIFTISVPVNSSVHVIEEWIARYNGPGNYHDMALALVADQHGNTYVTGHSKGSGTGSDYATIKYSPDGNELWVTRYNSPSNRGDCAYAITLDISGNVYVIGSSYSNGTDEDYVTIKYDSNGKELWVARYNAPGNTEDLAEAIAIDSLGNVIVTGTSGTVAYDSSGNERWVRGGYKGSDITTDSSGNIYVTGFSWGSGMYYDYLTIKYDSFGNEIWAASYNHMGYNDYAYAIAKGSFGNLFVTGSSYGNTSSDFATIKYDPDGNELWVARYDGPINAYDVANAITTDSIGNIYVTGRGPGMGTNIDYATVAYDSSGNELWVARYNSPGNDNDWAWAITLDSFENVYVTGTNGTVAYDSSGNERWSADGYEGRDITVDQSANVIVTGWNKGSGTEYDYVTIKYSQRQILKAKIDIDPDTLNLKSKGKWITAYIDLPEGYHVNEIDISTVLLSDVIPAEWGDVQGTTLMVKFDRSDVEDLIDVPQEKIKLTVTGKLTDGTEFGGSDTIRVIEPP